MNAPILAAFGPLGTPELIIIAVLVLVMFGAKKLPTFARSLGRSVKEFQHAKTEFEAEMHRAADEVEKEKRELMAEKSAASKPVERQRDHQDA
jgi:sec-independent protein translocase protein TatA